MKKLRKTLEKNKVYFEIILTIALVYIAIQANNISENQMRIETKKSQPSFSLYNEKNGVKLTHNSGIYNNLSISIASTIYASVDNFNENDGHPAKEIFIVDNNIFPFVPKIDVNMELNLLKESDSVFLKAKKLHFKTLNPKSLSQNGEEYWLTTFNLNTYIKLNFEDFDGIKKQQYYLFINNTGFKIPNEKGAKIFENDRFISLKDFNPIHFEEPNRLENVTLKVK